MPGRFALSIPFLSGHYRPERSGPTLLDVPSAIRRKPVLFGKLLERLRLAAFTHLKRESFEQAASRISETGILRVHASTLFHWEQGRVPNILAIKAMAMAYGLARWDTLVAALVLDLERKAESVDHLEAVARDQPWHGKAVSSPPASNVDTSTGGADAGLVTTRLLEEERRRHNDVLAAAGAIGTILARIATGEAPPKTLALIETSARVRGGDRDRRR